MHKLFINGVELGASCQCWRALAGLRVMWSCTAVRPRYTCRAMFRSQCRLQTSIPREESVLRAEGYFYNKPLSEAAICLGDLPAHRVSSCSVQAPAMFTQLSNKFLLRLGSFTAMCEKILEGPGGKLKSE
mgnify:CR=1 FL=1